MAYMLRRRLTRDSDISGDATWRYKLPAVGKFTAIELVLDCQRSADRTSATTVYPLETQVSKIELLEGATRPLVSVTGEQLDALNYWDFRRPNARRYRQAAATGNIMTWFLLAGRDLYDRQYGYDFGRLAECYLEFSHLLTADAAEKFDVSSSILDVYGWQWMGPDLPSFTGYFRSQQIAYYTTTAADALKPIAIAVGRPLRRIGVQSCTRATTIGGAVKELELVVNDGEYSPVHIKSPMHHCMGEVAEYDLHNELGGMDYAPAGTAVDLPYWFSYYQYLLAQEYLHTGGRVAPYGFITVPARVEEKVGTATECTFEFSGWGFQKCLRIGFDHERDGFDLFPTAGLGALDLQLTETAASKVVRVFKQDVLSY